MRMTSAPSKVARHSQRPLEAEFLLFRFAPKITVPSKNCFSSGKMRREFHGANNFVQLRATENSGGPYFLRFQFIKRGCVNHHEQIESVRRTNLYETTTDT